VVVLVERGSEFGYAGAGGVHGREGNQGLGTEDWVLGTGYWVLGTGDWVLGTGYWILGTRY
jgi:hypothetical protein